jgi:hypothetical protein
MQTILRHAAFLSVIAMVHGIHLPANAEEAPTPTFDADATRAASWLEGDTLTGDWAGHRTGLKEEHGITLTPRLTQFYQ